MEDNQQPGGADLQEIPESMAHVVTFWNRAAAELAPIRDDLARMYRDAGAAGIMEQRALGLGVMLGYLESIMAKAPSRIAELGSLYGRLTESERRAYDAFRKHSKPRKVDKDLASMA